ncbi:PAS domain-containing protein [Sphingomonas sp. H160509]|uniref:PAS domain-containing protein n=1 Tax=Sphingomonas sp. H160509 TaxID=2955313 RepID=UPI002097E23E|nr:PAS domain-containing protein [Sphingomonas sp. H160509]MDD1452978.1 PAS domain-containing protein [Sphingomonas sp. H160509]
MQRPTAPTTDTPISSHASEDRYRALVDAIDAGFCIIDLLFDGERSVDYRFIEVNPRFESQTGLVDPVGRTASELVPDLEAFWFETYGRVASTGQSARFDHGSEQMGRWFDVHAFRVGNPEARQVAVLFTDISERRSILTAAQASEERLGQALAAGNGIGTWDWDVPNDRVTADERFSTLYGVSPSLDAPVHRSSVSSATSIPTMCKPRSPQSTRPYGLEAISMRNTVSYSPTAQSIG